MEQQDVSPVTAAEKNGIWWFFSNGRPFVSLGLNHTDPYLLLGPYNKAHSEAVYGTDLLDGEGRIRWESAAAAAWLRETKSNAGAWGFNTFGYHNDIPHELLYPDFYFVASLHISLYDTFEAYPDVFGTLFAETLESHIRRVCTACRSNPYLIGYAFTDLAGLERISNPKLPPAQTLPDRTHRLFAAMARNQLKKSAEPGPMHPCVRAFGSLAADAPGKRVWTELLRSRYGSPEEAARVYGLPGASWEALAGTTDWPEPADAEAAARDSDAMLALISEQYYALHYRLIKTYDPDHLILGDKLNGASPVQEHLYPILQKYVDVLFIEWVSYFEEQETGLAELHRKTGKPILMGDSAFAAVHAKQIYAKGVLLASQDEVGPAYETYLRQLMQLPFVIGWHHCGYMEGWEGVKSEVDPHAAMQCGFIDPFGQPYEATVRAVAQANAHAFAWHGEVRPGGSQ